MKEKNGRPIPVAFSAPEQMAQALYSTTKKMMWSMVEYKELRMMYTCALKEIRTKLEVLSTEFNVRHRRNPISSIDTRLKRTESILEKMQKRGIPITLASVEENIHDVAGIRVICSYIDDIYSIADALLAQDDVRLVERKDYIKTPKGNGYRSLHLIVTVPVFFAQRKKEVKVEVQIRTIAMDFWASLEHQMKYKQALPDEEGICAELRACAEVIAQTDRKMLALRKQIESAEDTPTEDELLLERLRNLDIPFE